MHAKANMSQEQKLRKATLERDDAQEELGKVRRELGKKLQASKDEVAGLLEQLSAYDGGAVARAKQLEARLEAEREKRVEALTQGFARRLG